MAINKVIVNGETKLDLTADTATVDNVQKGFTFHDATGVLRTGVANVGGIDGYYIEKIFDANEIHNDNSTVSVDITTNGKYCFFYIDKLSSYINIIEWYDGTNAYDKTVYVISTQPIENLSWYENSSSSSY